MQKAILFITLFLFGITQSNGQLTNTWNFSTGHDNANGMAITNGQDSEWVIVSLTAPNAPPASYNLPYPSFVQGTWGAPPTPINTQWVSFNPTAMLIGVYDSTGGTMTLEYQFETCQADTFNFYAMVMADNEITQLSIDDTVTGFIMASSTVPELFSYDMSLNAGVHTIRVVVENYPYNLVNAIGLNISGIITGRNASIVDKMHFPNYTCLSSMPDIILKNTDYRLSQNSPNPFRGETKIEYNISKLNEAAYISVNDLSGKTVYRSPISKMGEGSVTIDAKNLTAGLYFYSLVVNGIKVTTKKMLVEK